MGENEANELEVYFVWSFPAEADLFFVQTPTLVSFEMVLWGVAPEAGTFRMENGYFSPSVVQFCCI